MKCVHTFGTGRHKRQADITLLFQYMLDAICSVFFGLCFPKLPKPIKVFFLFILCKSFMHLPFMVNVLDSYES